MDEVQNVYKKFKPQLTRVFRHYARAHEPIPGQVVVARTNERATTSRVA